MAVARFRDRRDAGQRLAPLLAHCAERDPVVLALPRGGVEVAYEVARELSAPLDVLVVRKLGVPGHEELAFGAIGEGGEVVVNEDLCARLGIGSHDVDAVARREGEELRRRVERYRGGRIPVDVAGRTAIIVDDGLATGSTAAAALKVIRHRDPAAVVLAVPVAPPETVQQLSAEADEVISALTPPAFMAVGQWYERFDQTTDDQVVELLHAASWA